MDFIKKNINKTYRNGNLTINNSGLISTANSGGGSLTGSYLPATMDEDGNYVVDLDKVTFNGSIIAEKEVSSYGVSSGTGSGSTGSDIDIIDTLESTRTDAALSANQGRELKSLIDGINADGGVSSWNDLEDKPELLTAENIAKWNTQSHTHTNKTVLDGIDATDITNWDNAHTHISDTTKHITAAERINWNSASANSHTHTNKTILDNITSTNITNWNDANSKKHTHSNKDVLDGIDGDSIDNWNDANSQKHSHNNKSVLDGITTTKVGNWDSVYTDWNNVFEIDGDKVKCKLNFVGEKEVSSYGVSDTAGSGGSNIDVIDSLTSSRTDAALSANMGRELKSLIDTKTSVSDWDDIQNKPSTFTPSQHTHTIANVTGLQTALDGKAAVSHTHSIYCLNNQSPTVDLNTINGTGIMNNPANADATTARHYPIAEAGIMIYGTTAYGSSNQIYGSYNSNRWFARGGGEKNSSGNPVKTSWKEFAFKTNIPASLKNPNALTISLNGTSQGAYDGSAAKSINITPANIGAAASSHTHSYLPLSGGTMTGSIKFPANQFSGAYAIDANNSDIVNVNGLFTNDSAQNATEGINFKRSNGKYDGLWALDGTLYFSPNGNNEDRNLNDYSANYKIWHAGNDGSGSGLDADTLDGLHSSDFAKCKAISPTYADYQYWVVGLLCISNSYQGGNGVSQGKLYVNRYSGGKWACNIDYNIYPIYNSSTLSLDNQKCIVNMSINGYSSTNIRPCTFVYNGKKYAGICWRSSSSLNYIKVEKAFGETEPFFVRYYNSNTSTVLNAEINNSIKIEGNDMSYSSTRDYGDLYINGINAAKISGLTEVNTADNFKFYPVTSDHNNYYLNWGGSSAPFELHNYGSITLYTSSSYNFTAAAKNININSNHIVGDYLTLNNTSTNPYLKLVQGSTWYVQAYNNMLQLGAGTAKSIKIDSAGNIILPSASANSIKFNGGSSDTIGGEIYFNGTRTCIGRAKAGDFNAGSILVSNAWADYPKVPTNGIYSKGNILSAGEVTSYSDERFKSDIKPLDNRGYVKPVTYTKDGKESIGFIAQEMQKIYPELVTEDNSEEKYLSINYAQYTAVLQQQIIELKDELDKLKEEIKALKDGNK